MNDKPINTVRTEIFYGKPYTVIYDHMGIANIIGDPQEDYTEAMAKAMAKELKNSQNDNLRWWEK